MSARAALLALALVSASASASAGTARAATPAIPKVSTLPVGDVPEMAMRTRPAHIGAGERAPGFWVVRPGYGQAKNGKGPPRPPVTYVQVYSTEAAATAALKGRHGGDKPDGACFLSRLNRGVSNEQVEWHGSFTATATVHAQDDSSVHPLRSEQVVIEPNGTARLAVAQAWVDARTQGVRLVSRTTLPLARIASGPRGLQVYAARRGEAVEIVVVESAAKVAQPFFAGTFFLQSNGLGGSQQGCGHVRFALRTIRGAGETATVQAEVPLPPQEGERQGDENAFAALGLDKVPREQRSTRARPLRIGVSTSWASRDPEAILSVAMGWAGRERSLF